MRDGFTRIWPAVFAYAALAGAWNIAQAQTIDQLRELERLTPTQQAALVEELGRPNGTKQPQLTGPVLIVERPDSASAVTDSSSRSAQETTPVEGVNADIPPLANLEAFGYELFSGQPTTFAPATDIPVPVDYVIGPGDTIVVPIKPDPISNMTFWIGVTTILYNIGIAAAAVSSF